MIPRIATLCSTFHLMSGGSRRVLDTTHIPMIELEQIRADFPVLAREICLDNGTVSITPAPVAASLEAYLRDVLQGGPPHVVRPEEEYTRRERTMSRIAEFL